MLFSCISPRHFLSALLLVVLANCWQSSAITAQTSNAKLTFKAVELPPLGQVDRAWFGDNPYSTDSSVHAYVIAKKRDDSVLYGSDGEVKLLSKIRQVVRLVDARGLEEATVRLRFYSPVGKTHGEVVSGVVGYTHNFDQGKVQTQKLNDAQVFNRRLDNYNIEVSFSLPSVRPGSVIEYVVESRSDYVHQPPAAYLQTSLPVQRASYYFIAEGNLGYGAVILGQHPVAFADSRTSEGAKALKVSPNDLKRAFGFSVEHAPALHEEPFMGSLENYMTHVELELELYAVNGIAHKPGVDWEAIADNLSEYPGIRTAMKGSKFLEQWAAQYSGPTDDVLARTRWALRSVAARLNWDGAYGYYVRDSPEKTTEKGKGTIAEINAVLLGLCREMGLEAYPIFLSTREHGFLHQGNPDRRALNAMIVGVIQGEKVLLLDATDITGEPGVVPKRDLNGDGLMVLPDAHRFVALQDRAMAQRSTVATLQLDESGYISGTINVTLRDYAAFEYTELVDGNLSIDAELLTKQFSDNFEVTEAACKRQGEAYVWLYTAKIKSRNSTMDLGDMLGLSTIPDVRWSRNQFSAEKRKFPIEFATQLIETRDVTIKLPTGYVAQDVPAPLVLSTPDRTSQYRNVLTSIPATDGSGHSIKVQTMLAIKRNRYPVEEYDGLRKLFSMVAEREQGLVGVGKQ